MASLAGFYLINLAPFCLLLNKLELLKNKQSGESVICLQQSDGVVGGWRGEGGKGDLTF